MDKTFTLAGRHILITGASSGIGRACAIRANELGARVCLVARDHDRLQQVLQQLSGDGNSAYCYDLADVDGIEAFVKQVVIVNGKFDGMMYCAGDCFRAPLVVCKPSLVRQSMQVNYFAFVELLRCVSKVKHCNEGASLVTMTSASSLKGEKGLLTLCASKAAMNGAVRCAAHELAPKKIRVNAIASAYVQGSRMVDSTREIFGFEQVEKNILENQPLGVGQPEDVADAAVFLLSDASRYITGSIMMVDGGYMA